MFFLIKKRVKKSNKPLSLIAIIEIAKALNRKEIEEFLPS